MNLRALAIGILSLLLAACTTKTSPMLSSNSPADSDNSTRSTTAPSPESVIQLLSIVTIETSQSFNPIVSLEFNSNSKQGGLVLAAGGNGTNQTYLWSVPAGQLLTTFPGVLVGFIAMGEELITESPANAVVQVFDVSTTKRVGLLTGVGLRLNPARTEFVSWSGRIVDIASGQELRTLETQGFIQAFNPDGKMLAVTMTTTEPASEQISLLDVETGKVLQSFTPQQKITSTSDNLVEVTFDKSGRYLAAIAFGNPAVRIWDISSGQEEVVLAEKGSLTSIVFSPEGHFLVVGHKDGALSIWDWAQDQNYEFPGQGAAIYSLAFSPDGHYLAAGNENGIVQIWEIKL